MLVKNNNENINNKERREVNRNIRKWNILENRVN